MKLNLLIAPLTAFVCVVAFSRPAPGAAAKVAVNQPYVQSMKQGVFYARCIPSGKSGSAGFTEVYRVRLDKDERVARYEWYCRDGLVLGWSPIAGAISVMARPFEPSESPEKQVELRFYLGDKHLKSWTTAQLQALGAPLHWRTEDDPITRAAAFELLEWQQIDNSNEYVFTIRLADGTPAGKVVAFDILTAQTGARGSQEHRGRSCAGQGHQAGGLRPDGRPVRRAQEGLAVLLHPQAARLSRRSFRHPRGRRNQGDPVYRGSVSLKLQLRGRGTCGPTRAYALPDRPALHTCLRAEAARHHLPPALRALSARRKGDQACPSSQFPTKFARPKIPGQPPTPPGCHSSLGSPRCPTLPA